MPQHNKREHPNEKSALHPRNKHRERYDFKILTDKSPDLSRFVKLNPYGDESIDFFNPEAVKMLNKSLLKQYYDIGSWDIPAGYLCPPIPGRADYIHYMADLLGNCNDGIIPTGNHIKCLDIGVGANCVYPIIGVTEYGWSFVGTEIDRVALAAARTIIETNSALTDKVKLRLQADPGNIFEGVIRMDDHFDLTICNPPFHASARDAQSGTIRKLNNLSSKRIAKPVLNFGGQQNELWCEGGELRFVQDMIRQSKQFSVSSLWFSTLISKESNLKTIYNALNKVGALVVNTIPMGQGNKISRIVAWTFLTKAEQKKWVNPGWKC